MCRLCDSHRIPRAAAGEAAERQKPVAFLWLCLWFLLHRMTAHLHHHRPLQIRGKWSKKTNNPKNQPPNIVHESAAGKIWLLLDVLRQEKALEKWEKQENGSMAQWALSSLDLQWRLPLPSIFTMPVGSCSHTSAAATQGLLSTSQSFVFFFPVCEGLRWLFSTTIVH